MHNTKYYIVAGGILGAVGAILVYFGNPANMGICAACFLRDTAGALGFHSVSTLWYVRPEIIGLVFGGFLASIFWTKEFSPTGSSSAFIRFFLGVFAMIGCLIFLGCPWRAFLRLGGGDMSAIAGILGLIVGVFGGFLFKKRGYELPSPEKTSFAIGYLPTIFALILLLALVFGLKVGENGALFSSIKGPGSMHADIAISLMLAILVGIFMQKSKFCSVGAFGRMFRGDFSMLGGVISIVVFASIFNMFFGQYKFGFENQPIAHNQYVWNFFAMALAGLCFSLSEGCPGKHLVQMGCGNLSSAMFIIGMMAGAAFSHNFILASSPKGISEFAPYSLILGFVFAIYVGFFNVKKVR